MANLDINALKEYASKFKEGLDDLLAQVGETLASKKDEGGKKEPKKTEKKSEAAKKDSDK
ncbi:MAG: hypothetical protein CMF46_00735 [Legionellales bacterium]|nr:hypothetical protein [Legionellales bacterium]|tara:strand:- start:288 stop:467 length:180 start_codon:yes stop_codon:yes gene_type:complete